MRPNPHLYEVNAGIFLRRLSAKYGRKLTLSTIPEAEWLSLARRGFDLVWLMGIWERSPKARQPALAHPSLRRQYSEVLPDWTEADIGASPYSVYDYRIESSLGRDEELAGLKSILNRLGIGLILDFVPNHLALDHPWTLSHPKWFVRGRRGDIRAHPDWFYSPEGQVYLAHGRDPYFPPWTDTAQVNFFSEELRQAQSSQILRIAEVADGVRCDMAMLALNAIFEKIWGRLVKNPRPKTEFWTDAIRQIKQKRPDFIFIAEVYWGLERKLLELGFDFVYDKVLYDKLLFETAPSILRHLTATRISQSGRVRFIENHDELRAVTAFGRERSMAAGAVVATLPGLRLFHDGQLEGKRLRLPLQLLREPDEVPDAEIVNFYNRLLEICNAPIFHEGEWDTLEVGPAWEGNGSFSNLLAWRWHSEGENGVVVVNYSQYRSQGRVKLPLDFRGGDKLYVHDELNMATYTSPSDEVRKQGLYIELDPWQSHILLFEESDDRQY